MLNCAFFLSTYTLTTQIMALNVFFNGLRPLNRTEYMQFSKVMSLHHSLSAQK